MRLKQSGNWKIHGTFANEEEEVCFEYASTDGEWYNGEISATLAACRIRSPFVFLREDMERFLMVLTEMESQLELPKKAAVFRDFTHQNFFVIGPFAPHQAIMFFDLHLRLDGPPDREHLGIHVADRFEGRYRRTLDEIDGYPEMRDLAPSPDEILRLKGNELLKKTNELPNTTTKWQYGISINMAGLQFNREEIRQILSGCSR